MSEFLFGLSKVRLTRQQARQIRTICEDEGNNCGLVEVNIRPGFTPGVNNGQYQRWFAADNLGCPFDGDLQRRVMTRVAEIVKESPVNDIYGVWCVRSAGSVFGHAETWAKKEGMIFEGTKEEADQLARHYRDTMARGNFNLHYYTKLMRKAGS